MAELTKLNRIDQELEKMHKLYQNLPENKLRLLEPLIQNASFMKATLEDLQEIINKDPAPAEPEKPKRKKFLFF